MAYTKTNLNETTETVAVDMTAEDIENNETTETAVEQNARGYSKTVWNESTPITADKLNKMETGIANGIDKTEQIMEIPITNSEGWQQFRWTRPNHNSISWTRDAPGNKAIEIYNETTRQRLLLLDDDGNLATAGNLNPQGNLVFPNLGIGGGGGTRANIYNKALQANTGNGQMLTTESQRIYVGNPETNLSLESSTTPNVKVGQNVYQLYHTGNFNPATKLDAGYFTVHDRDLRIHGKRAMVGFNTADGNYLELNYGRDFAAGVRIQGLTAIESIETPGKLTFYNQMGGGQMSSLINCQELQNNTGNGQMLTASVNRIFVGNPNTQLVIESSSTPIVNADGGSHSLYHTGNKPSAWDIGALPISGGTLSGNISVPGESKFYDGAYTDPWHGQVCSIKASGNVGIGGSLKVNGNLAFSNYGGSESNANIHSLALHAATGNGQIMTVGSHNVLYIGNSNTPLTIESSRTPDVNVGGTTYQLYHTGNKPTAWDIGAMSSNAPTFQGNMIQAGAGGRDWIYHINADAGSLHIAPHSNGNNDWDRQIMFDRNGVMYCNGRKKVPTMADQHAAHYMFRYGSGIGGANGYITFSY